MNAEKIALLIGVLAAAPWLVSCAGNQARAVEELKVAAYTEPEEKPQAKVEEAQSRPEPDVIAEAPARRLSTMPYLSWLEGELQTDYQPDRDVAREKLQTFEGKEPDPKNIDDYLDYLTLLNASGKPAEAETKIKKFLSQNPAEKRAVFLLGVHYLKVQKKDMASYFFKQLEKDKTFPWKSLLYNNLGLLALHEKNRGLALDYLEKAVKAQPPTAAPFVNLGALYLQSKSYGDAQKMFARAVDLDGDFEDAALGLGAALEGLGKFEEAHTVYSNYISHNNDALSVLYNDSIVLGNRLQQKELAAQLMTRYIQRGGKETAKAHENVQSWR